MPVLPRTVLRVAVGGAIAVFAVRAVTSGAVSGGWDVIGLAVALFTLSYAALACGHLLPGRRTAPARERLSPASPSAAPSGPAPQRQLVRS